MRQEFDTLDHLHLEVQDTPTTWNVNRLPNPTGATGSWGWLSDGGTMESFNFFGTPVHMFTTGTSANRATTEPVPLEGRTHVRAAWMVIDGPAYRAMLRWHDVDGTVTATTAWTNHPAGVGGSVPTTVVPGGAVGVSLQIEIGSPTGTYPSTTAGVGFAWTYTALMFGNASDVAAMNAADPSTVPPPTWTNILGGAYSIRVVREELNLGTLSAEMRLNTYDADAASQLRKGRPIRLRTTSDRMFTGKISTAAVSYDQERQLTHSDGHVRVSLTAEDRTAALASVQRDAGAGRLYGLPMVLEGGGIPWSVNGYTGHRLDFTAYTGGGSLMDHTVIARDTARGSAWVDRNGVLQVWDSINIPGVGTGYRTGNFLTRQTTKGWTAVARVFVFSAVRSVGAYLTSSAAGLVEVLGPAGYSAQTVTPGQQVTVTAELQNGVQNTTKTPRIAARFYAADGTLLSSVGADGAPLAFSPTFADRSATFTVPAGAHYLAPQVGFYATASGQTLTVRRVRIAAATGFAPTALWGFTAAEYLNADIGPTTCINVVGVRCRVAANEFVYSGLTDATSVIEHGPHKAEFTVGSFDSTTAWAHEYAAAIHAANGTPVVGVRATRLPVRTTAHLARAAVDICDRVRVTNVHTGLDSTGRVTRIEHTITHDDWVIDLGLDSSTGVAMPTVASR